jgi:hypothetical protein
LLSAVRPGLPVWIDGALRKAVHPNPALRYEALSAFTYDLRHPNPSLPDRQARPHGRERDVAQAPRPGLGQCPGGRRAIGPLSAFTYDLRHPNPSLAGMRRAALLERNPVLFWKLVSLGLGLALLALLVSRAV